MKMESETLYFPTNKLLKISFHETELMLVNFIAVLDKTLIF